MGRPRSLLACNLERIERVSCNAFDVVERLRDVVSVQLEVDLAGKGVEANLHGCA